MSQVVTKFITPNAADDTIVRLRNNQPLRARNQAGSGDVSLISLSTADIPTLASTAEIGADPTTANGLVRKSYADALVGSSTTVTKQAVEVVSTSNLTLSAEQTIDGVLTSASRILVAGQTTGSQNGIYVTGSGAWTRATDADSSAEVLPGMEVFVRQGDVNSYKKWALVTAGPITLGTTSLVFRQIDEWNREVITLVAGDITNQYVDLAFKADLNSIEFTVDGGGLQRFTADYTHSIVGGVSRLTFDGDLATGGGAALIATDVLRIKYLKRS